MSPMAIKRLRKKLGLTQIEFANLVGHAAISVSYWETGRTKPSPMAISKIRGIRTVKP